MRFRSVMGRVGVVAGLAAGVFAVGLGPAQASDPRVDYAPIMYLQSDETHWPMSAATFVAHSSLKYAHVSRCNTEHVIAAMGGVNSTVLAGGYSHRDSSCIGGANHDLTNWYSNQWVRPYTHGGPSPSEQSGTVGTPSNDRTGMFLNLDNNYRDGQGLQPPGSEEPVYTRFISGNRLEYWFNYGHSRLLSCPGDCSHEGDWEHIAIKLDANNHPLRVEYFYHHYSCVLPWSDVRKSGNHPQVKVARESHGSYPLNGRAWGSDDLLSPDTVRVWNTTANVDRVADQPWWGYSGAWGELGGASDFTGPMGPGLKQPAPAFSTASDNRCKTV